MIVRKSTINEISKAYLLKIKELYLNQKITDVKDDIIITQRNIFDKDIIFKLSIKKIKSMEDFKIGAFYYFKPIRGKFKIKIILFINEDFNEIYFNEILIRIKCYLIHEIEHHLQRNKAPFREKLPLTDYNNELEYITDTSELEAYTKQIYYISKKTGESFYKVLIQESLNISKIEELQTLFITSIIKFISKRKDLNLYANI